MLAVFLPGNPTQHPSLLHATRDKSLQVLDALIMGEGDGGDMERRFCLPKVTLGTTHCCPFQEGIRLA